MALCRKKGKNFLWQWNWPPLLHTIIVCLTPTWSNIKKNLVYMKARTILLSTLMNTYCLNMRLKRLALTLTPNIFNIGQIKLKINNKRGNHINHLSIKLMTSYLTSQYVVELIIKHFKQKVWIALLSSQKRNLNSKKHCSTKVSEMINNKIAMSESNNIYTAMKKVSK